MTAKYDDIFQSDLGTVQGDKANIHVNDNATPVFLRTTVENKLARIENEGIIKLVYVSKWATPIVCVPEADGNVRLCGDYKVTVNKSFKQINNRYRHWMKFLTK